MFLLALIVIVAAEIVAFVEVGHAIGWLLAILLLFGTSVLGTQLLRRQGRAAIARVTSAMSERRAPGRAAANGILGFLGGVLLVIPGFVTDAFGLVLLFPPTRTLTRRWMSRHYGGRVMGFAAMTGRFATGDRGQRPADVDSTAVEDDLGQLGQ
jgi:UPF0716 protein FxsA